MEEQDVDVADEKRISGFDRLGPRPELQWDKPAAERGEKDLPENWKAVREYDERFARRKQAKEIARAIFLQQVSRIDLRALSSPTLSLGSILRECEYAADLVLRYGEEEP